MRTKQLTHKLLSQVSVAHVAKENGITEHNKEIQINVILCFYSARWFESRWLICVSGSVWKNCLRIIWSKLFKLFCGFSIYYWSIFLDPIACFLLRVQHGRSVEFIVQPIAGCSFIFFSYFSWAKMVFRVICLLLQKKLCNCMTSWSSTGLIKNHWRSADYLRWCSTKPKRNKSLLVGSISNLLMLILSYAANEESPCSVEVPN